MAVTKTRSSEYWRRYAERHPDRVRKNRAAWKERNLEAYRASERDRYFATYRFKRMAALYGVTREWYEATFATQKGLCAICRRPERRKLKGAVSNLSVDHCHRTGAVRGLLCSTCNHGIAKFEENTEWLSSAIDYLSRSRKR